MHVLWTPEAIQDRQAIYAYIEADNPIAALMWKNSPHRRAKA